jgi:hypothetical protein
MTKPATRAKPKSKGKSRQSRTRPEYAMVMMTSDEKQIVQEAAALAGVPLSVWLRALGLKEARRMMKQG